MPAHSNRSDSPPSKAASRQRALRLYALGQAAIVVGAWFMHQTGSMWPMALGASAGLMFTAPLVRSFFTARVAPRLP